MFRKIIALSVSAALLTSTTAGAAGFAIGTQSGSGTGNAFAGGAAVADDASVAYSNPAGMTALPVGKHLTGALHVILPSFKFTDGGSTGPVFGVPGAGNGGDGGSLAFVPNGFFVMDLGPQWRVGLALNAPFGLKTEYDPAWRGQVTALKSDIKTININPSIAYKVNNMFSIGVGASYQRINAELSAAANAAGTNILTLKADDNSYGFNAGATFQPSNATRIGLQYRSSIKYKLDGTAIFSAGAVANGGVNADLKVPETASLSILHQATSNVDVMADVTRTGWNSVQQLAVIRTTNTIVPGNIAGSTLTTLPFLWENTWRFGLGANYRLNPQTKLRFGLALDKTPTQDATRTPRLPDQDRTWLAFGVQYKPSKQGTLEVGYAHEFVRNASVVVPAAGTSCVPAGCLIGTFKNKADILSLQYSHSF